MSLEPISPPSLTRRVLATLTVLLLVGVGQLIPLPGVSWSDLPAVSPWSEKLSMLGTLSVGALSGRPIVSGFLYVEIVACLVPRWRRLRRGSVSGRKKLVRAAFVVSILAALAQSTVMAQVLEIQQTHIGHAFSVAPVVGSHVAWTALLLFAAIRLEGRGLVGGVATLVFAELVGGLLASLLGPGAWSSTEVTFQAGLCVVALLVLASRHWPVVQAEGLALPGQPHAPLVPILVAGTVPLGTTLLVLTLADRLPRFVQGNALLHALNSSPWWVLAPTLLIAYLFARGFYRPLHLRRLRELLQTEQVTASGQDDKVFAAGALSMVFYAAVAGAAATVWNAGWTIDLTSPFLFIAITLDAISSVAYRARHPDAVCVYHCHQVYWAPEIAAALRAEGVSVHLAGLRHRSLGHFFLPYVPIEVLVPKAEAAVAEDVLAELIERGVGRVPPPSIETEDGDSEPMESDESDAEPPTPAEGETEPLARSRFAFPLNVPLAGLAVGLLALSVVLSQFPEPEPEWKPIRPGVVAIHSLCAEEHPFPDVSACDGVTLEPAYGGEVGGQDQLRAQDRRALEDCLAKLSLPTGSAVYLERIHQVADPEVADLERAEQELVGWETRVVQLPALLTTDDLQGYRVDAEGQILVQFSDADTFADVTANHAGRVLVLVVGGEVLSAPVIQAAVTGGQTTLNPFPTADGRAWLLGVLGE